MSQGPPGEFCDTAGNWNRPGQDVELIFLLTKSLQLYSKAWF